MKVPTSLIRSAKSTTAIFKNKVARVIGRVFIFCKHQSPHFWLALFLAVILAFAVDRLAKYREERAQAHAIETPD